MKVLARILLCSMPWLIIACGSGIKVKPLPGSTDFSDPGEAIADILTPDQIPNILMQEPNEILRAVTRTKSFKITQSTHPLIEQIKKENFMLSDVTLTQIDQAFQQESSTLLDPEGFYKINTGKSIYPRIRPLILGRLYELEFVSEELKISVPGVFLRQTIKIHQYGIQKQSEEDKNRAQSIAADLDQTNLQIKILQIADLNDQFELSSYNKKPVRLDLGFVKVTVNPEILSEGVLKDNYLESKALGLFANAGVVSIRILGTNSLIEKLLADRHIEVSLSFQNSNITTFEFENKYFIPSASESEQYWSEKFKSIGQSTEENILKIKTIFSDLLKELKI